VTSQGDGDWLPIATAARRLGVTPKAIRGRIERGTIEVRAVGNRGREVLVTEPGRPRDPPRDWAAEVEAERMGRLRAEATVAAQAVLVEELRLLLADARMPWWRRWVR
jgi:hypothetical protein